jgi:phage gp36-like protein
MSDPLALTLYSLGPRNGSGQGTSLDLTEAGDREGLRVPTVAQLVLTTSVLVGAGALVTVTIQTSPDGTYWRTAGAFAAVSAASVSTLTVYGMDRYVRASYVVVGSAVTFGVAGTAHVIYASLADLAALSIPSAALAAVSDAGRVDALIAASSELDGYLNNSFELPFSGWGADLRLHTARLTAWYLMSVRGYNAETGADEIIRLGRDDAIAWATRIADGKLLPPDMVDATPTVNDAAAVIYTTSLRGW